MWYKHESEQNCIFDHCLLKDKTGLEKNEPESVQTMKQFSCFFFFDSESVCSHIVKYSSFKHLIL